MSYSSMVMEVSHSRALRRGRKRASDCATPEFIKGHAGSAMHHFAQQNLGADVQQDQDQHNGHLQHEHQIRRQVGRWLPCPFGAICLSNASRQGMITSCMARALPHTCKHAPTWDTPRACRHLHDQGPFGETGPDARLIVDVPAACTCACTAD